MRHRSTSAREERAGKYFGTDSPLLVSVRFGAAVSIPGTMDTILNLRLKRMRRCTRTPTGAPTTSQTRLGTAVNVMQMVLRHEGDGSDVGACFTRDPSRGEPGVCGEFLRNAQGRTSSKASARQSACSDPRDHACKRTKLG